jgi:hypothetical protein
VTVKVSDVADLAAFEVKMYYDDCIINVTRWIEPTTDPDYVFYGKSTLPVPSPPEVDYRHVDPCNGSAHVGAALFPPPSPGTGFTGSGLLCIFEFNITAVPPEGETYSCTLNINNADTYLLDSVGEEIPSIKENGYYEFSREAPPPPLGTRLYVYPPEIIDPTILPSSTFTVNITIDDVENMQICEFNLTYDTNILGWVGVSLLRVQGQMPSAVMAVNDEAGYIWIKLTYPNPITTSDPVALVKIEFHVENSGATPLDLQDTKILDPEGQPIDHEAGDGYFATEIRDVAVTNVVPSRNWVYQGWLVNITVTAKNLGDRNETFDVEAYYESSLIDTQQVVNLAPDEEIVLTFTWNTSLVPPCNNYTITGNATIVPNEINVTNNVYIDGAVKVYSVGDANRDGKVNMADIYLVIAAFGSYPEDPRWNPDADIDRNGKINMLDIYIVVKNFGKDCAT